MRVEARLARLENAYALHHVARMTQAELAAAVGVLERLAGEGWERLSHEDRKQVAAVGAIFFLHVPVEEGGPEEGGVGEDRAGENCTGKNP